MIISFAYVVAGLLLLVFAGDALVRGAVSLALKLGIPAFIVSLTVVAFGTSAPELLVAVQSALEGAPGIAFGNVVGSNTANILLVLGVPAMLFGMDPRGSDTRRSYLIMLGVSVLFIALCFGGTFYVWQGALLLGVLTWTIWDAIRSGRKEGQSQPVDEEIEGADVGMSGLHLAMFLGAGLIGLPLGAHFLIAGAVDIAKAWGLSEAVIGLTIVAIGTSLPELATTVMAAMKRQADVALGNVIGSNMFNILAIMGVASFFGPLEVPAELLRLDLWVMLVSSILLIPFVFKGMQFSRPIGIALTGLYGLYLAIIVS